MRKNLVLVLGAGSIAALAFAASLDKSSRLQAFVKSLEAAESVQATLTIQKVGGGSEEISLALSKPNKARIETSTSLTIADGETVTIFDKSDNTFVKQPQSGATLAELLQPVELMPWRPFFDPASVSAFGSSKDAGDRQRSGKTLSVVEIKGAPASGLTATFYLDKADSSLHQVVFNVTNAGKTETKVVTVGNQSGTVSEGHFAFVPPAGAKEISEAELASKSWMTDFDQAVQLAAKFNKTLVGDFYADWCGPCKMLSAEVFSTAEFKKAAKDFILVKINVDHEPELTQKYRVEAMPTVVFWTPKHQEIKRFVGFKPLNEVLAEMASAKNVR
ncbi:MAG: thioredoxin family protein [Fimbriimonadaceae bacterium]|nr:thioredoxin family protein [Fimbriimonadaceae bacterium]QYK59655.1 MAG: thioredoxin family protein [Fimbriimonadaceae bacterium]